MGFLLPTYVRHFNGAFFYFLQNIINSKHQLLFKYDWYDPNIKVKDERDRESRAQILLRLILNSPLLEWDMHFILIRQIKLVLYYDLVRNEITQLPGYTSDIKDNIFTCRLQFRF